MGFKLRPARRKLICREKKLNLKRRGEGNDQNAQYISLAQGVFSCVHCDFKALKRAELKNHKQSVHGEKKQVLQCDQCEKSFNKSASLRDHKLFTHEGFKFKCKLCDFQVGIDQIQ